MKILKWLEHTSDWSMILDVPSFSVTLNIGVNTIADCLAYTVYNNEFFMKHRTPGATKFLNVLQGNDIPSADEWYEAVFLVIKNYMVKKHLKAGPWAVKTCVGGN